jgi:hypothetical protein
MYFITTDGYLGTGFLELEKWDEMFVLFRGSALYIIRPVGKHFKFLGNCYVYSYMNGEAIDLWESVVSWLSGSISGRSNQKRVYSSYFARFMILGSLQPIG